MKRAPAIVSRRGLLPLSIILILHILLNHQVRLDAGVFHHFAKAIEDKRTDPGRQCSSKHCNQAFQYSTRNHQCNSSDHKQHDQDPAEYFCSCLDFSTDFREQTIYLISSCFSCIRPDRCNQRHLRKEMLFAVFLLSLNSTVFLLSIGIRIKATLCP